jgi:hypothetical protein
MEKRSVEGSIPDIEGPHGRAWRCDLEAIRAKHKLAKGADATVCAWIVEAKWAHPLWECYALGAIHLRPMPGTPPAKISLEGATHEVILYALDPGRPPDLFNPLSTRLEPANFCGQWRATSDLEAEGKIEGCVREIVTGHLSPDTDFIRQWVERFSGSNLK